MEKAATVGGLGFLRNRFDKGHDDAKACCSPTPGIRTASTVAHPIVLKISSSHNVLIVLSFATTYLSTVSAQYGVANFSIEATSYACEHNIICLGSAHAYQGDPGSGSGIQQGRLSFVDYTHDAGVAYYRMPVKLGDNFSRQVASFNTSFTVDVRSIYPDSWGRGDGMTFIISSNNSFLGGSGGEFGIFDAVKGSTPFKSIVVEFDTYNNSDYPQYDINGNHVSFDFNNVTVQAVANADDINVTLSDDVTKYVWLEYRAETQTLEARVSYNNTRPVDPLLNYTVDLFNYIDEFMWVGFSSSSGDDYCNFYIGNWTFVSYGVPPPARPNKPTVRKLIGILLGSVAFLLSSLVVIIGVVLRRRSSRRFVFRRQPRLAELIIEDQEAMQSGTQLEGTPERFTYQQLSVATKAFREDTKLGQGGFGSVYRGVLSSSGISIAVKKIHSDSNQGQKEFKAEVSIISQLRHRNLIQLQGWCKDTSKGEYLLVYELMPNGSLDKVLFASDENPTACLSWAQRFNIVTGTAAAVDYLHRGWKQQVIHRDIKSSNIMLDAEWNAKLGDFGLARLVDHKREAATTQVAGTVGYLAPEVATRRRFTEKTDVFAFGAVLLEIACGRNALGFDVPEEEMILVDWVWEKLSEGNLISTVDKRLENYDAYWMEVILKVGLLCSHPNPLARPCMRRVVEVLAGDLPVPPIPLIKPQLEFSGDATLIPPGDSTAANLVKSCEDFSRFER